MDMWSRFSFIDGLKDPMGEYGTKSHISFVFKLFALFLRNSSVCGRVLLYLCAHCETTQLCNL